MMLLLLLLFFIVCSLSAFLFFSKDEDKDPLPPLTPQEHFPLANIENEKLQGKLKKLREESQRLMDELVTAKKNEEAARNEADKIKGWIEKDKTQEENLKKEVLELKDKLVRKDQEHEKEFSHNLSLKKEGNEYKQKLIILENVHRENAERLKILEAQNNAYRDEFKKQNQLISELKKKGEDSQWIAKKEYDELKGQLARLQGDEKDKPA